MTSQNAWVMRLPWSIIEDVADAENVPKNLLGAIIQTESSNNKYAVRFEPHFKWLYKQKDFARDCGITEATETVMQMTSWGLCQLMGALLRELGHKGPMVLALEEQANITYCAKYLKRLATRYKDGDDIIAAYNAGSPIKGLNGQYKNQAYVDKVKLYLSAIDQAMGAKNGKGN
jgi:soluble lytic murein transglycosylase-like protein